MSRRRGGKRYSGKFDCTNCQRSWISRNAKYNIPQTCHNCNDLVMPIDLDLISPIDTNGFVAKEDQSYFGAYQCIKCHRTWFSAYSYLDFGQMCKRCKIMTKPFKLRPREKPEGLNRNDWGKVHEANLCERCQKLGTNCSKRKT